MNIQIAWKAGSRDLIEIYVEGELWREVHRTIFGRHPRFSQDVTSLSQLEELVAEKEYAGAKRYALWRLARSSLSSMALCKSLQQRHVSEAIQQSVVAFLQKAELIDDNDYVQRFVVQEKAHGRGPAFIRAKLKNKGIPSELIDPFLRDIDEDEQQKSLVHLLSTRYSRRNLKDPKERQKVIASLIRRGFSFDSIKKCIRSIEH